LRLAEPRWQNQTPYLPTLTYDHRMVTLLINTIFVEGMSRGERLLAGNGT